MSIIKPPTIKEAVILDDAKFREIFLTPVPDATSVRQAVNILSKKLGADGTPTFTNLTLNGYFDLSEIEEPTPLTSGSNLLRVYNESIKGFSFLKYLDDTGMKRAFMRDSVITVKNIRGTTIAASRIVYATGSENQVPTVDTAKSDSLSTMPAIGVTIESIANGAYGRVMQVGLLENINTSAYSEGDVLFVSDSTAGVPTATKPVTPSISQEIGTVLVSDASVGAIQIVARGITGSEFGTIQNNFYIGSGITGSKTLIFNSLVNASIIWDETKFDFGANNITTTGAGVFGSLTVNGQLDSNNIYPNTDDTYYLGKNDDDTPFAWKGIILKDQAGTGKYYRIEINNDALQIVDLTD